MSDVDERRRASDPRLRQAIARLTSRWVTVRYGKRGRTRAIPLEEDALAAIAAWVKARPAAASECCCRCRAPGQPPRALTTRDVARYAQAAGLPEDRRTCCAPRSAPASPTRAPSVGGRLDCESAGGQVAFRLRSGRGWREAG